MTGFILVHLDWPWVYEPKELREDMLPLCEKTLDHLERALRLRKPEQPLVCIQTPEPNKHFKAPRKIQAQIIALESPSFLSMKASDELENLGAYIARKYPQVTHWKIGGFWKDLCCSDVRYGANEVTPASLPEKWSVFVELAPQPQLP